MAKRTTKRTKAAVKAADPEPDPSALTNLHAVDEAITRAAILRMKIARAALPIMTRVKELQSQLVDITRGQINEVTTLEAGAVVYATEHKAELFAAAKTVKLHDGELKLIAGRPSVKTITGKTANDAIAKCQAMERKDLIVDEPKLWKEEILKRADAGDLTAAELREVFLRIESEPTIKLKVDGPVEMLSIAEAVQKQVSAELAARAKAAKEAASKAADKAPAA